MADYYVSPAETGTGNAGTLADPYSWHEMGNVALSDGDNIYVRTTGSKRACYLNFSGVDNVTVARYSGDSGQADLTGAYYLNTKNWTVVAGSLYDTDTPADLPANYASGAVDFEELHVWELTGSGNNRIYRGQLARVADQGTCFGTPNSWYWTASAVGINLDGANPNDYDIYMSVAPGQCVGEADTIRIDDTVTAIGDTSVTMDVSAGTSTVVQGDCFTVAGDSTVYRVTNSGTINTTGININFTPRARTAFANNAIVTFQRSAPIISLTNCDGWTFRDLIINRPKEAAAENLIEAGFFTKACTGMTFENCHLVDPAFDHSTATGGFCLSVTATQAVSNITFDSNCLLQGRGINGSTNVSFTNVGSGGALFRPYGRQTWTGSSVDTATEEMWAYQTTGAGNTTTITGGAVVGLTGNLSYGFNVRLTDSPSNRFQVSDYTFIVTQAVIDNIASTWSDYAICFDRCLYSIPYGSELSGSVAPHDCGTLGHLLLNRCDVYITDGGGAGYGFHVAGSSSGSVQEGEVVLQHCSVHYVGTGAGELFSLDKDAGAIGRVWLRYSAFNTTSADALFATVGGGSLTTADAVTVLDCAFNTTFSDSTTIQGYDTGNDGYEDANVTFTDPGSGDFEPDGGSSLLTNTLTTVPVTYSLTNTFGADRNGNEWGDLIGQWQDGVSPVLVAYLESLLGGARGGRLAFYEGGFHFRSI